MGGKGVILLPNNGFYEPKPQRISHRMVNAWQMFKKEKKHSQQCTDTLNKSISLSNVSSTALNVNQRCRHRLYWTSIESHDKSHLQCRCNFCRKRFFSLSYSSVLRYDRLNSGQPERPWASLAAKTNVGPPLSQSCLMQSQQSRNWGTAPDGNCCNIGAQHRAAGGNCRNIGAQHQAAGGNCRNILLLAVD